MKVCWWWAKSISEWGRKYDAIAIYLCADKKLRLRSEIGNAGKEAESVGERRRRETNMFERGVDFFAVRRLAGGCWHIRIWLGTKAGLMSEWRLSAGKFEFCLLISAVGERERRKNFVLYGGHLWVLVKGKSSLTRWSEQGVEDNYCMALKICCWRAAEGGCWWRQRFCCRIGRVQNMG